MKLPKGWVAKEEPRNRITFDRSKWTIHVFTTGHERDEWVKQWKGNPKPLAPDAIFRVAMSRPEAEDALERGARLETHRGPVAAALTFLATDLEGRLATPSAAECSAAGRTLNRCKRKS